MTATTRSFDPTALDDTLCLALEARAAGSWALPEALGGKVLHRTVIARDGKGLLAAIAWVKAKLALPEGARGVSLYEAGRDGFWRHRFLVAHSVENLVIDSSSLEVNRRRRRAKTDRLDLDGLLDLLVRHRAKRDRTRVTNRMKGLLANQGLTWDLKKDVSAQLAALRQWNGKVLPAGLRARLAREWERVAFYDGLVDRLEAERREQLRTASDPVMKSDLTPGIRATVK